MHLHWSGYSYSSWRFIILLVSIPSFISSLLIHRYPESPRFLLAQGRAPETLDILSKIWEVNTGRQADSYPVSTWFLQSNEYYKSNINIISFNITHESLKFSIGITVFLLTIIQTWQLRLIWYSQTQYHPRDSIIKILNVKLEITIFLV